MRVLFDLSISNDEWAFVAFYLTFMREDAPQQEHELRELFSGLRWIVRSGVPCGVMPNNLSLWEVVCQQTQHWLKASAFAAIHSSSRRLP